MNRMLMKFLDSRGLTLDDIRSFADDSCPVLPHTDEMCAILSGIRDRGETIVVLPDFDTDGIMSGVVGYAGLSRLGFSVGLHIPDPMRGYEVTVEDIDTIVKNFPSAKWIITCDVGITCFSAVSAAKERGLGVLITDHHTIAGSGELPCADCIVDPYLDNPGDIHVQVCGAFVLQRVLARFAELYDDPRACEDIGRLRLFAGLGSVGDTMDVRWENRALLRDSYACSRLYWRDGDKIDMVSMLPECPVYRQAFRGFCEILDHEKSQGKLRSWRDIESNLYGWYLSPLLNSSKRMAKGEEGHSVMVDAFSLFFGDAVHRKRAREVVFERNEKRKEIVDGILDRTLQAEHEGKMPLAPICYIVNSDGYHNVLGLVANKLIQINHSESPVYVCGAKPDGSFEGSFRCPAGYDGLSRVRAFGSGVRANGHPQAFGCFVPDTDTLVRLCEWIEADRDNFSPAQEARVPWDVLIAEYGSGDVGIELNVFEEFLEDCSEMRPFGTGLSAPVVAVKFNLDDAGGWKRFGSEGKHFRVSLPHGFDVIFWNGADKVGDASGDIYVVGELQLSFWNSFYTKETDHGEVRVPTEVRSIQLVGDFLMEASDVIE